MINAQPIELYNRPSQVSKADLRAADELATLWRLAVAGQVAVADAAAALGLTKVQANNRISYLKRKGYAAPQIVQAVDLGRSLGYPPCPKCGRRDTERFENMIYCAGGCAHTWQPPTPPPAAGRAAKANKLAAAESAKESEMEYLDMSQYKAKFEEAERLGKAEAATYQQPTNEDDVPSTELVNLVDDLTADERTRRLDAVERDNARQREFIRRADEQR